MEDGKNLEHRRRTLRCKGNGMYGKCGSELERPYPAQENCKEAAYKQNVKLSACRKGVRGVHSTEEAADNITVVRERNPASFKLTKGGTSE
jgi:hypothetical protein